MSNDARLREGLRRAMSAIESDTESHLDEARQRGHRRLIFRRTSTAIAIAATIAIVAVATPRVLDLSDPGRHQPAATQSPLPAVPPEPMILGTWQSEITCDAFLRAFDRAGIPELAARWLVNDGLQPESTQPADGGDLCRGSQGFSRTHTFRSNGTVITYQGQRLADDCRCFELVHSHTFIVLGGNGHPIATLHYSVDAETLRFEATMRNHCSSRCRGHFAWAVGNYAVTVWHRTADSG
jgi:hypothetical protein